ncbi:hypothetical protein [Bdellovibrio svalbardensis]|uniref:Uncharacterized protein n=1 Tax=Bdellovibrio svalbardensis TaxID=2972972 RepID=A0ABT6DI04_9BACT|nr:hypothetical protein [Bdellovibrio svalbardensis]MDG0816480.1 hypothetical protein [Bdellovibrio svalbardensis]
MLKRNLQSQKYIAGVSIVLALICPSWAYAINEISARDILSKEFLTETDTRTVGEGLANYIFNANDKGSTAGEVEYDFLKKSELLIIFRSEHLEPILREGFLNIHDTQVSSLGYPLFLEELPRQRAKHEDALLGLKIERSYKLKPGNPINKIRPKYALLQLTDSVELGKWQTSGSMYGDIIAVLKPETKRRATWTYADTLANKKLRPSSFNRKSIQPQTSGSNQCYLEAQIWGELDIKDVSHFLVDAATMSNQTLELLKSTGLPIYQRTRVVEYNRTMFKKDRLLHPGDATKIASLQNQLRESWKGLKNRLNLRCEKVFN